MHHSVFLINWLFCIFAHKIICDSLLFYISFTKMPEFYIHAFYIVPIPLKNRRNNYQNFAIRSEVPLSFPGCKQFLFLFIWILFLRH